jgi:hypothetical protein
MLTDEELTTRLSAAFHESTPELTYAGPVPQVRRSHAGLAATSAVAATAALVLTPAALQHDAGRGHDTSSPTKRVHTLDIAGLHLSDSSVSGSTGPIYAVGGSDLTIPPDAEKLDVGLPVDVYYDDHPASGAAQVYVRYRACPDTNDPCSSPPPTHTYGLLAPGWTRRQLIEFLEHPVAHYRKAQRH